LAEVLKICHIGETKANQAKMSNVKVAPIDIVNRVPNTYNTNERWVMKKMKLEYVNKIATILPIIYKKDKLQYFSNKFAMMISKIDHRESINWATIMHFELVKELIRWGKCQKNMIERIAKRKPKKDVCHSAIVL